MLRRHRTAAPPGGAPKHREPAASRQPGHARRRGEQGDLCGRANGIPGANRAGRAVRYLRQHRASVCS